jgi:DNA helicase-2/ATP-dependent DNA helicase PcrA
MRTSSQLKTADYCHSNTGGVSPRQTQAFIRASAQKNIIKRVMQGEEIPDIRGELESVLTERGAMFENYEQKNAALILYSARIQRYLNYQMHRPGETMYPSPEDRIITLDGEEIEVLPDFIQQEGNSVIVTKIKTGKASADSIRENRDSMEALALGELGKKLFPDKRVFVSYNFLGDSTAQAERTNISLPYDYRQAKISMQEFDREREAQLMQKLSDQKEEATMCSPEDCAGCSRNNICHFEEPPIALGVEASVRPVSEIHLTSAQRDIINFEEGIARVNAGAGAGKTLVVALRVKHLIEQGYDPHKICLLTFTKTGAEEMTGRAVSYLAGDGTLVDPDAITSKTINAFCQDIANEHFEELGYSQPPRVIPEEVKSGIINRILDVYPRIPEWKYGFTQGKGKYSRFVKNALTSAKDLFSEINKKGYTLADNPYGSQYDQTSLILIFQMCEEYNAQLKRRNMWDYDDQLAGVFKLLEQNPDLFEEYGYEHIMIDEFQDTDESQIALLVRMIETQNFKSFMAVGDDSQAIFSFRECSPEFMIHFDRYFGAYTNLNLVENHRSAANIIDFANEVNALSDERVDKDLIATKPAGPDPRIEGFYTATQEYQFIAHDIADRVARGEDPSSIAVLTSDRYEITAIASELAKLGVPSVMMNPIPYRQNSRVAALCNYFDSFTNGTSQGLAEYANVLAHGALKDASPEEMEAAIAEQRSAMLDTPRTCEAFIERAKELDPAELDDCYQGFLEKVGYCQTMDELTEFFHDFELYGNDSTFKREGNFSGVCLITVHSAKGMEWDTTYLTLSKFDRPQYHTSANRMHGDINESYRKWFVGATRARKELIMTGQYVLRHSLKDGITLNDYVRKAYELTGKVYGYNPMSFYAEIEAERAANGTTPAATPQVQTGAHAPAVASAEHEGGEER